MNKDYRYLLKKAGTIAGLLTGAIVSCSFGTPLVQSVLGGVFTSVLSNKLSQAKLKELQQILSNRNPANLNHHIEKLTQDALAWSIKNICYKYEAYCQTKTQKTALIDFKNHLVKKIEKIDPAQWKQSNELLKEIDGITNENNLINLLMEVEESIPTINEEYPFTVFFSKEFVPNFQLCFGELLKAPKNKSALIAYNRNISIEIQKSLRVQDAKIDQLLKNNQDVKEEINNLKNLPGEIFAQEIVIIPTQKALDKNISSLKEKVSIIIDQNGIILSEIEQIRKEGEQHTQQIKGIERKIDRLRKNKYLLMFISILVLALAYFSYKYWQSTQPFIYTVAVSLDSKNIYLPKDEVSLELSYNDVIRRTKTTNFEAIFKDLPSFLRGDSIRIKANTHGFEGIDTLVVAKDILKLKLKRDDTYSTMRGIVKSNDGNPVPNALVQVLGIGTYTYKNGFFELIIPEEKQKTHQRLKVSKDGNGFKPWEKIEPVLKHSESIIQLEKQ
jgi:hypothetical protein